MTRGVFAEAGVAIRRSLEGLGVLTHFWSDPTKVNALSDPESSIFKDTFIREADRTKATTLKKLSVSKRFAAYDMFARPATDLYRI